MLQKQRRTPFELPGMTIPAPPLISLVAKSDPSAQHSTDSQQQHYTPTALEGGNKKRHLRERHFTNYNEDFIQFDNLEFDEKPFKRGRLEGATTVPSISASHLELETAWAVVVNAGESILDEEEDLLPPGAHEQVYVQVQLWICNTRRFFAIKAGLHSPK